MQQQQVGALFAVFVRTIGAVRFVRAIAPVAALVAVASIPLPRAASPIDVAAPSSGLVRMLDTAQRAVHGAALAGSHERQRRVAHADIRTHGDVGVSGDVAQTRGSSLLRADDRWMQLQHGARAMQRSEDAQHRHAGDRLLHAAPGHASGLWSTASTLDVLALLADTVKPVASTGAAARAPPGDSATQSQDRGHASPAPAQQLARTGVDVAAPAETFRLVAPAVPPSASAATEDKPAARDTVSPLKLSPEQRNISRFVARRYRVNLDVVQRFVAHAFRAAGEFRIDPYLVLAVMSIESSFNPNARSSAGAQGLMQVLTRVHLDKFAPFGGARAALDPVANITVGSRILKEYLVREGSVEGALKSYVGAALLPHDFGYGNKVLVERARIVAAARDGTARLPLAAQAGVATRIAMADAQRPAPGSIASASGRSALPARSVGPEAKAPEPVIDAPIRAEPIRAEPIRAEPVVPSTVDAAAVRASPSRPAQVSEPQASAGPAFDASASSRDL